MALHGFETLPLRTALALVMVALTLGPADADNSSHRKRVTRAKSHPKVANPCAVYGPGFVKMPDSDICLKFGGGIDVEAGRNGK